MEPPIQLPPQGGKGFKFCGLLIVILFVNSAAAAGAKQSREADLKAVHDDVMKQIQDKETEYEKEQEKLKETRRETVELGKKERQVFKKLDVADKALSKTRGELALVTNQLTVLEKDIAVTRENWNAENTSQERRRRLMAARLKALFLFSSPPDPLKDFLSFGHLAVPARARFGLISAAVADHELIGQIGGRKAGIEKIQELLQAKQSNLLQVQEKKAVLEQRQDKERLRRQQLLDEVQSRKSAKDELARRLEEESANLKLLLTILREQSQKLKEQMSVLKKEFEDKKGLLPWPVEPRAIKSVRPYGKFFDESIGSQRVNKGIDIATETNQNVRAVSGGEVVHAEFFGRMGNLVILSHGGEYFTLYAHLSEIGVKLGGKIEQGDAVGRAGNTGLLEESAVLHFEIRQGSQAVDPENWLGRR